jgi:transcriptional regulator with XRE-family HTH domain
MRAFGERLQTLRNEAGLSEDQLAERSRLNPSIITKAEAGQTDPRLSQIASFARGLGVPLIGLLEGLAPSDTLRDHPNAATTERA